MTSPALPAIRALRKAQPGAWDRRPWARTRSATPRAEAIEAGATAYVVKSSPVEALTQAVDAAAEAERFVDPAAGRPAADRRSPAASARSFSSTPTATRPRGSQSASA